MRHFLPAFVLVGALSLVACGQLTGPKPGAKTSCIDPAVDRTDTLYQYATAHGDTVVRVRNDSLGTLRFWYTQRVQIPATEVPCRFRNL